MRKATSKSLYLFLCSILGMILFTMLHRAIFVLYGLLLEIDFQTYSFGLSDTGIATIDFVTMMIAVFLGGWYGTLLGIDWYAIVYGPNAENPGRLFHGFVPHHWRDGKKSAKTVSKPVVASATVKPVASTKTPAAEKMAAILNRPVIETPAVIQKVREWTFDDLLAKPQPVKKAAVKKTATKKTTVRKSAVKRVSKTTS